MRGWIFAFVITGMAIATRTLWWTFEALDSVLDWAIVATVIMLGGIIAFYLASIVGSIILPPIFRNREKVNGAPFVVGEELEILSKPRRGERAIVTEVWSDRYAVRLRLSGPDDDPIEGVLDFSAVRRVDDASKQQVE